MPNGSTTKFTEAIAAISRAVVDAAIRQYVAAALELKIDELRNLRHQHQRDPEKASDGHRPARGRLPFEWRGRPPPPRPPRAPPAPPAPPPPPCCPPTPPRP